jgi:hypothetical protein
MLRACWVTLPGENSPVWKSSTAPLYVTAVGATARRRSVRVLTVGEGDRVTLHTAPTRGSLTIGDTDGGAGQVRFLGDAKELAG